VSGGAGIGGAEPLMSVLTTCRGPTGSNRPVPQVNCPAPPACEPESRPHKTSIEPATATAVSDCSCPRQSNWSPRYQSASPLPIRRRAAQAIWLLVTG
jgi:hypothetical protein